MADQARTQVAVAPKDIQHQRSWLTLILKALVAVITAPYRRTFKLYTWAPISAIRAAGGDRKALIPLARDFKVDKYAELQSVQVAASFCTGATLSTLPWSRDQNTIWVADALWFSSLACAIWAVITSIQMKSILDDLPSKEQMNSMLPEYEIKRMRRTILRYKKTPGIEHWIMLFIWQFPSMTMSYAWATFIAALTMYICTPFIEHNRWGRSHKIAIVYLAVGGMGLITYILSSVFVYVGEKDFERSVANTRVNTDEAEAGISPHPTRQAEARSAQQGATKAGDPIQTARARVLPGGDPSNESRKESDRSGRSKRQLLI